MAKRGVALVLALLIGIFLTVIMGAFFLKTMSENNQVQRAVNSTRAFWLAEAGVAEGIESLPDNASGTIGSANCAYSAVVTHLAGTYYQIDSAGTVTLPSGGSVSRSLSVVVRTDPVDADNFQHAIRTTVELRIQGSVDINGPYEDFATFSFPDLFDNSQEDVEDAATHTYTDPINNITPVDGITWVNLSPGEELHITSNTWTGSGLLVVAGDCQITGGTFDGIIYVMGKLRMSGNPVINGSILAESDTEVVEDTSVTGNVTINYDATAIADALAFLDFIAPVESVAWREI